MLISCVSRVSPLRIDQLTFKDDSFSDYVPGRELIKVVRNLKMLVVGRLRHTFSTRHNLIYNCLITKS